MTNWLKKRDEKHLREMSRRLNQEMDSMVRESFEKAGQEPPDIEFADVFYKDLPDKHKSNKERTDTKIAINALSGVAVAALGFVLGFNWNRIIKIICKK